MSEKSNIKLTELHLDEVNVAITEHKHHINIKPIKDKIEELNKPTFSFDFICREEIVKEIDKLSNKKPSQKLISL